MADTEDFWGEVGVRNNYRLDTIKTMSNRHLIDAIRHLHWFRYKSQEQKQTYDSLTKELQSRQTSGTI